MQEEKNLGKVAGDFSGVEVETEVAIKARDMKANMALLKSDTQCKTKAWKNNLNARNAGAKNE